MLDWILDGDTDDQILTWLLKVGKGEVGPRSKIVWENVLRRIDNYVPQ